MKTSMKTLCVLYVLAFVHACIYVLGFVPADVVRLKKVVWFKNLDSEQITSVEKFLKL